MTKQINDDLYHNQKPQFNMYFCALTLSLFLPESDSDAVGSDSDGETLSSSSRSLEEPRAFLGGGGR